MSFQSKLDDFYQIRSMNSPESSAKKRPLSLKKSTPCKSKKITEPNKSGEIVEVLSSDEEGLLLTPLRNPVIAPNNDIETNKSSENKVSSPSVKSDSSTDTIVYNVSPGKYSQPSPAKSSPQSAAKYFSPTKKRLFVRKNIFKPNLSFESINVTQETKEDSDSFAQVSEGLDDKTVFLLRNIHDFLNKDSLKKLLDENTQNILKSCMSTVKPGIRLVCRLYWYLPGWYPLDKLRGIACDKKKEKLSMDIAEEMLTCLVNNGLLTSSADSELSFDEYEKLVTAPSMLKVCKELKLKCKNKEEAVKVLRAYCNTKPISSIYSNNSVTNLTRVLRILKSTAGRCYKLSDATRNALSQLYVLMYLGIDYTLIREKKLEFMLINNKAGIETTPIDKKMELDDASVVFKDKDDFARYYEAVMFREKYLETSDAQTVRSLVMKAEELYKHIVFDLSISYKLPPWLLTYTPVSIYINIMEGGIQELKKAKTEDCYICAVSILGTLLRQKKFGQHKRAEWIAEKALIYHKYLKNPAKAAKVLLQGLKSDLKEETRQLMMIRAKKLANQKNITLDAEMRQALLSYSGPIVLERDMPGEYINKIATETHTSKRGKLTYIIHTEEGKKYVSVEDYCVEYYLAQGDFTHAAHWEGRMVNTIFFLLFWDIIYTKPEHIEGVFLSYFQRYPLDLFTDSFYENRKAMIDDRLYLIENSDIDTIVSMMKATWDERPENELSELMRSVPWSTVEAVSRCVSPRALAALSARLATNYAYSHSGFPDVTAWNSNTKQIKILEVKSDEDKPSIKQLQWIQYLLDNDIDAGFCYIGGNSTRKARPTSISTTSIVPEFSSDDDDFV